jgi:sortase (surface protein transpeptidase)
MTLNQILKFNFLWTIGFILIISLVILYIFQLTSITQAMYSIKNYSRQLEGLSQENEILEIKFSQLNSLENLRFLVTNLNLEKVEKIDYIEIPVASVVKK